MMWGRERKPERVDWRFGPFVVPLPQTWTVVRDGTADGLVVLDPQPERPIDQRLVVRANVLLRYYTMEHSGGLGAEALREARAAQEKAPESLLIDYGCGHTEAGLEYRIVHAVVPMQGRAVQSMRWFIGDAEAVLEIVLTFEDEQIQDMLWDVVQSIVEDARLAEGVAAEGAPLGTGVDRDPFPSLVLPESGARPEGLEALGGGFRRPLSAFPAMVGADDLSIEARYTLEDFEPVLLAEGIREGRVMRFAAYRDGMDAVLAVATHWGDDDEAEVIEEFAELPATLVPLRILTLMGFHGAWIRQFEASVEPTAEHAMSGADWQVTMGGEPVVALLSRLSDSWFVTDGRGGVVAEWQSAGDDGLVSVFRDGRSGRVDVMGLTGFTVYTRMLASWVSGHAV